MSRAEVLGMSTSGPSAALAAANQITTTDVQGIFLRFLTWIRAQEDPTLAAAALESVQRTTKNPDRMLVNAATAMQQISDNDDGSGTGDSGDGGGDGGSETRQDTGWRDISDLCLAMIGGTVDDQHYVTAWLRRIDDTCYLELYGKHFVEDEFCDDYGPGFSPVVRDGWPSFRRFPFLDQTNTVNSIEVHDNSFKFAGATAFEMWGAPLIWVTNDPFPASDELPGDAASD